MTARARQPWMIAVLACGCGVDVAVAADSSSATAGATDTASNESSAGTSGSSAGGSDDAGAESPLDSSGGEPTTGNGPKLDVDGPDGDDDPTDCVPDNDLIWVIVLNDDRERRPELHQFDPEAPGFVWVSDLECLPLDDFGDTPMSLGAERGGRLLISSVMPDLWTVDVTQPDPCTTLAMLPWSPPSQTTSLAFAGIDPDVPGVDRLYTHSSIINIFAGSEGQLGWGDLSSAPVPVTNLGETSQPFMTLTGTADGRVYGLGGENQLFPSGVLVELDVDTGESTQMLASDVPAGHLAFYGGDLVLFDVNPIDVGQFSPRVLRFDLDDDDGNGEHELVEIYGLADAPPNLWIRGVASPTCVPQGPRG